MEPGFAANKEVCLQMVNVNKKMAAAVAAVAVLGAFAPGVAAASPTSGNAVVITANPWYANGPFEGWGTSLAWFANATGSYGEEGSIINADDLNDQTYRDALAYGKQLREEFYQSIFGEDGLDLNMARYNIGGGNASDVAYGYPFMRQGAAVPGYWADDADGSKGLYDGASTTYANKDAISEAFDPTEDTQYDWSKGQSQEWWLLRAAQDGDITHLEAFANSAPWFMTDNGYATGAGSGKNNLKDVEKFAQYLAKSVEHLNSLKAENGNAVHVDTVEPLNESETWKGWGWGTPSGRADGSYNELHQELIDYYWNAYYTDKNKSVTPYDTNTKKPQEGMDVDAETASALIQALDQALSNEGVDADIAATDANDSGQFVDSYNTYPQETRDAIDQYNTHSYGTNKQRVVRDIAQSDGKLVSQSEVDGDFTGTSSFDPYNFNNALGMASKINNDVYALQSKDFNFWQVVEDLYNMSTGDDDVYGNDANPDGENLNWGTVFISFDCTVAGQDGKLYSERDVNNNDGSTEGIQPCSVIVNSKYNAVRAYTKFIHEGDAIIANNRTGDTMTATSADGQTQTVIHTNNTDEDRTVVIDLSKYGEIADDASGVLYLTTEPEKAEGTEHFFGATPEYMNTYSNVQQDDDAVVVDAEAKTATLTVPARSIASIQLTGVTGVADEAGIEDGQTYQIVGQSSNRPLTAEGVDDSALSLQDAATTASEASKQMWVLHEVEAPESRPMLRRYVITDTAGKVLVASDGTNKLVEMDLDAAKADNSAIWMLNTENGETYSFVNVQDKKALDCNGQSTAAGTKVGLWESGGGAHQAWYIRSLLPSGVGAVSVQTPVGVVPQLPETITVYYTGEEGRQIPVTWDDTDLSDKVTAAGTYTVHGSATDMFGNEIEATATVVVGAFTVTDPASLTVVAGSSVEEVKAAAPSEVTAHVVDSEGFPAKVSWDWSEVTDESFTTVGTSVAIPGTVSTSDGSNDTLPATLTVYVTAATRGSDALDEVDKASASATEINTWSPVTNTYDDNKQTVWSNWGTGDTDPWLQYEFTERMVLDSLEVVNAPENKDHPGHGEAEPASFTISYRDAEGNWRQFGESVPVTEGAGASTEVSLAGMPATDGVRLNLTYNREIQDWKDFVKIAEVSIYKAEASPAQDTSLGDLRIDGVTIDGFDADTSEYTVSLPAGANRYPTVTAYPADTAASVDVEQASETNNGKATITVTSADGSATCIVTVDFGKLPTLVRLDVTAPNKTEYLVGDEFDATGMKVMAVYEVDDDISAVEILLDDSELSISGFDSVVAGQKLVTVTYRGVSASFEVTVSAIDPEPNPDPNPNPDGDGSGDGATDGSGSGGGDGSDQGGSDDGKDNAAGEEHQQPLAATGSSVAIIAVASVLLLVACAVAAIALRRGEHRR